MTPNIKNILSAVIGLVLGVLIAFASYRVLVIPSHNKELKRLENIISDQSKVIEKLGSIEKYNYQYDVKNKIDIKNKNR